MSNASTINPTTHCKAESRYNSGPESPPESSLVYRDQVARVDEEEKDSPDTWSSSKRPKFEDSHPPRNHADERDRPRHQHVGEETAHTTAGKRSSIDLKGRKLACPYFKRSPRREGRPVACIHPGFSNVARLKEHLYRIHKLPIKCPRCHQKFHSEQGRTDHLSAPERCVPQPQQESEEGFNKEQELRLRTKKRSKGEGSEEEKWKTVFMILFPDSSPRDVPSAYLEPIISLAPTERPGQQTEVLDRFELFSNEKMHQVVKRRRSRLAEVEPQLLVDFLRECQKELFDSYRETGWYRNITSPESVSERVDWAAPSFRSRPRTLSESSRGSNEQMVLLN